MSKKKKKKVRTLQWKLQFHHVVRRVIDQDQDKVQVQFDYHLVDIIVMYNPQPKFVGKKKVEMNNEKKNSITLCGELRTLWTLLNWLLKIVDVRNMNDGGRAGSGRLTLENGSVSSRYWTRHCNVDELPFNPVVSLKVFVVVEASDELDITFEIRTNSFRIEILQMISMTLSRRSMNSYSIPFFYSFSYQTSVNIER